jgi:digeranylgeranylglycerophospholipid reductase
MDGARIFSPNGTKVTLAAEYAGSETGYVVYRDIFDQELARRAVRKGAELLLDTCAVGLLKKDGRTAGVKARYFDEDLEIEADIVVGADGVESRVGKWAGIQTTLKPYDLETCIQYTLTNVECDAPYCDFYLGSKIAPGMSQSGLPQKLLDQFIAAHPELKNGEAIRVLTGADPVAKPIESVQDNLLLVGDAARHVDPITGGGLMHSIEGGKLAGNIIGKAVQEQKFDRQTLFEYETLWSKAFGKKLLRNYVAKEILIDMEDKTLDMLADSLKDYKFEEFSTLSIIKALVTKHPSLMVKLTPLIKLART